MLQSDEGLQTNHNAAGVCISSTNEVTQGETLQCNEAQGNGTARRKRLSTRSFWADIMRHTLSQNKMIQVEEMWQKRQKEKQYKKGRRADSDKSGSSSRESSPEEHRTRRKGRQRDSDKGGSSSRESSPEERGPQSSLAGSSSSSPNLRFSTIHSREAVRQHRQNFRDHADSDDDSFRPRFTSPERETKRGRRSFRRSPSSGSYSSRSADRRQQRSRRDRYYRRANSFDRNNRNSRRSRSRSNTSSFSDVEEVNMWEEHRQKERSAKEKVLKDCFRDLGNPLWRPDKYYHEVIRKPTPYLTIEEIMGAKPRRRNRSRSRSMTSVTSSSSSDEEKRKRRERRAKRKEKREKRESEKKTRKHDEERQRKKEERKKTEERKNTDTEETKTPEEESSE